MRVLLDIGHPAHVHYFRNLIHVLNGKHTFIVTIKRSKIIETLLAYYNIDFIILGDKGNSLASKVVLQASFTLQVCNLIRKHKIDMAIGVSITIAQASKLCGIPSIYFDDDDLKESPLSALFGTPFASVVLSPSCLKYEKTPNAIYYPGYHELAYLHPNRFTPDQNILAKYGLTEEEKYFILRFSALKAHHDVGAVGLNIRQKRSLIELLSTFGKVFITMEALLDKEFEQYRMPIEPQDMHNFLHYSRMLVCDGQTMCTEAALLGVPSFRCNSFAGRVSVLEEEEKKYGLTYAFLPRNFDWMFYRIRKLLSAKDVKESWKQKRDLALRDKIDVTAFWAWFLDNYPASKSDLKKPHFDFQMFR